MHPRSLVFLVLAASACHHKAPEGSSAPASGAPATAASAAAVTVDVWPAHWAAIAAHVAAIPPLAGIGTSSFWALAQQLAKTAGIDKLAFPPPGLDDAQPISLELFAPATSFESTALAALRAVHAGKPAPAAPSVRLRVTFPAHDPQKLASALRAAIAARDPSSGSGFARTLRLRVAQGTSAVAVDIDEGPAGDPAAAAPGDPPHLALAFTAPGDSAARLAIRVDRIGDVGATLGMYQTVGAIGEAPADEQPALLAAATAEILTGYLLADPGSELASEAMLDVPADPQAPPEVAFALAGPAPAVLSAAGLAKGATAPLGKLHWTDAIAAAPRSPFLASALAGKSGEAAASAMAELFQEGGPSCMLYLLATPGNALPLAGVLPPDELAELLAAVGTNLQVEAAREATWTPGGLLAVHDPGTTVPSWTAAAALPSSAADACYRKALIAVRAALHGGASEPGARATALGEAHAALADAERCVAADPTVAARARAMRDFVNELVPAKGP